MSTTSSSEPGVTGTSHIPIEGCTGTFQVLMAPDITKPSHALMTRKTEQRLASRRDSLVTCETCGREVPRQMRGQRFCSAKCRDRGRGRSRKSFLNKDARSPATPTQKARVFNGLDWAKRQSGSRLISLREVIDKECFGGRPCRDVISPDGVDVKVYTLSRKR
jgi:hypothetical protein